MSVPNPNPTHTHGPSSQLVNDPDLGPLLTLGWVNSARPERSLSVTIAPHYGSNIIDFSVGPHSLFVTDRTRLLERKWTGCPILWPFPNRYSLDGRKGYLFGGRWVSLTDRRRLEGDDPLIHGLVDDQPWTYTPPLSNKHTASATTRISITPNSPLYQFYPYPSTLELTFTISSTALTVAYTVYNRGDSPLPSVFALHPFYALLDGRENTSVCIPALSVMNSAPDLLPTGELLPVSGTEYDLRLPRPTKSTHYDHVWTNLLPDSPPYILYPLSGLRVSHITTPDFTHLVYYTRQESTDNFVCIEPQTGSTNAINLHSRALASADDTLKSAAHLITVDPGSSASGTVTFEVTFT